VAPDRVPVKPVHVSERHVAPVVIVNVPEPEAAFMYASSATVGTVVVPSVPPGPLYQFAAEDQLPLPLPATYQYFAAIIFFYYTPGSTGGSSLIRFNCDIT
jgi:hypothetical protein